MKIRNKLDHMLIVGNLTLGAGEEVEVPEIDEKIRYAINQGLLEEVKEEQPAEQPKEEQPAEQPKKEQPKEENKKETSRGRGKNNKNK